MKDFRKSLLNFLYPILKVTGKIHAPLSKRSLDYNTVCQVKHDIQAGDVIISYNRAEFTNFMISGKFKHTAMYIERDLVIEAVDPVVKFTNIHDFVMTKDAVAICRPKFLRPDKVLELQQHAMSFINAEYDYQFFIPDSTDEPNRAFYCSEMAYWIYKKTYPDLEFDLREVFGVPTIKPDDFFKAKKYFQRISAYMY